MPVEGTDYTYRPLLRVYGVGKYGFRSVVDGLAHLNVGAESREEWNRMLKLVKR
jgi:hypothetical protein